MVDLPYRLGSWALDDPRNVGLWVDTKGHLLAWAVMQTPFCAIDYAFAPDTEPHLHRQLLAWADQRATEMLVSPDGNPCWFVNVFTDQPDRIHELDDAGFACQADVGEDSWSKVLLHRPAHLPVADNVPPPGFAIRPLAGEAEVEAYVALHRAVFESNSMTAAWRARTLHRPEYSPDIDLVAVAPDGRLAAFCICWIDDSGTTPRGQIEPLRTSAIWGWDGRFCQKGYGGSIAAVLRASMSKPTSTGMLLLCFTRQWGSARSGMSWCIARITPAQSDRQHVRGIASRSGQRHGEHDGSMQAGDR
ncbi:MAG: hypothetical protein MUF84_21070 [Anaerolineae bacterium]|nr:hypothetical protein [Anaerolineae bacterium]